MYMYVYIVITDNLYTIYNYDTRSCLLIFLKILLQICNFIVTRTTKKTYKY